MFHVYILWSPSLQKYYTGHTENILQRLHDHNAGRSQFTSTGVPWTLVYSEEFPTKIEASRREQEIKNRKSKKYIEQLIRKSGQLVHPVPS